MDLTKQLVTVAKAMGLGFTVKSKPVPLDKIFACDGMLPGFFKRAEQLSSLCFGYRLGVNYTNTDQGLMGAQVELDQFTPDTLRLILIVDVVMEISKNSSSKTTISLDELMYD